MALLSESPDVYEKFLYALSQYSVTGYVDYNKRSQEWIRLNLECSPISVSKAMWEHAKSSGPIKRVPEGGNPEDYQNEFHDDVVVTIDGRKVYIETVFDEDRDKESCRIFVKNVKWAD